MLSNCGAREDSWGFPSGTTGKEPTCQSRRHKKHGFYPWVGKITWRRWQPTPVFLPGKSPWMEEPGRLQSMQLKRNRKPNWSNLACMHREGCNRGLRWLDSITDSVDMSFSKLWKISFPGGSDGKASDYNAGDLGSITGLGRFPREGNGKPLQYFCLENSMDRGAW